MKLKFRNRFFPVTSILLTASIGTFAFADPVLVDPEISITAPTSIRAVAGTSLAPLNFSTTNLITGSDTAFGLSVSAGSVGSINNLKQPDATVIPGGIRTTNAPFSNISLLAGNTGTISATPNISGILVGQSSTFGLTATNATWNAPVTSNTSVNVVSNRLLTGTTTIDAGRHIAGLQSIGSISLNGGALTGSEGTNISVSSGGYAQLANGLRLTSASDFTFNGANQTHDLQISYNRPTGAYSITNATLLGSNSYTDASRNAHQEFGGVWKTSAEYGNVLGAKQTFTEQDRAGWESLPGNDIAWKRPGTSDSYFDPEFYIYNQEIATTAQPTIPATRQPLPDSGVRATWELARGAGVLVNERINPLIAGEVIQGSSLDLSGVSFNITGTAVTDRRIQNELVDLGRRMVGSIGTSVSESKTVYLTSYGDDENNTRLSLGSFSLNNSSGVAATHLNSQIYDGSQNSAVQVDANFTIDTAIQGRNFQTVDAGAYIGGEGLAGENVQNQLLIGYTWNNLSNNELYARDLLVIDSNTKSFSRGYGTIVGQQFSTETHTDIGWAGNGVTVNGVLPTGLHDLGSKTVSAVAEGLDGEVANSTVTYNTLYASVARAAFTVSQSAQAGVLLTDGDVITFTDTGSGIYQRKLNIGDVEISGGKNLDYELGYSGGSNQIEHGGSRSLAVNYIGDSTAPTAGQFGRVSRAYLSLTLFENTDISDIVTAAGGSRYISNNLVDTGFQTLSYNLETRFDAPAASSGTSTASIGTDFGNNGLNLNNTTGNTSARFTKSTGLELLDSETISSAKTVHVEFLKLEAASPALVAALEDSGSNAASLAGIYGSGQSEFSSDIVELTGLDDVRQVLQVSYDETVTTNEAGAQLLWKYNYTDGSGPQVAWINAVLGNSNITMLDLVNGTLLAGGNALNISDYLTSTRHTGSYSEYLASNSLSDPELGAWGVDPTANKVWSVIDHNSSFAAAVPEPGAVSLCLLSSVLLLARRRKS